MAENQEFEFKYIFSEDYNPVYVNGVFGGITPNAEIVSNFTLERHPIPQSIFHHIKPDGSLGDESRRDPDKYNKLIVRFVSSGIILNIKSARLIRDWLDQQINLAEDLEAKIRQLETSSQPKGKSK